MWPKTYDEYCWWSFTFRKRWTYGGLTTVYQAIPSKQTASFIQSFPVPLFYFSRMRCSDVSSWTSFTCFFIFRSVRLLHKGQIRYEGKLCESFLIVFGWTVFLSQSKHVSVKWMGVILNCRSVWMWLCGPCMSALWWAGDLSRVHPPPCKTHKS